MILCPGWLLCTFAVFYLQCITISSEIVMAEIIGDVLIAIFTVIAIRYLYRIVQNTSED